MRRAFELRPDPVPPLDPSGEYLTRAWRDSVYPLAERLGMPLHLPPVQPRTRLAHEAAHFAALHNRMIQFHHALFRAFFERGEDIGQLDVLVKLGGMVGLDMVALHQALEARQFQEAVLADEALAQELGVRAVPSYLVDRQQGLSGLRTVGDLRRMCGM